jgi:hypothetical protein
MRSASALTARLVCALLLPVLGLAGCPTVDDDDATTPEPEPCQRPADRANPELAVQGPEDAQTAGFPVEILAQATDDDGIALVTLYYRIQGVGTFLPVQMTLADEDNSIYVGAVPGNYVVAPGVEFYVVARDAGPCADETTAPEDVTSGIPLYTDFEGGACDSLEDLEGGWTAVAQKFPDQTHGWRNDLRNVRSGSCSVSHGEGVPGLWECPPPEGDGTVERLNWLVSPALDLTTKTDVALRWFEREQTSGSCAELHSVYVSLGSPDPGDPTEGEGIGDYVLVAADLPKPGPAWQASDWIDLSEFAGAETAYVALVYRGGAAGRWQIDDLYVGEPLADLVLHTIPSLDPEVVPGTVGVALDLVLRNDSTEYGAPPLSALLETDDPDLTITAATTTFPAIGVGATGNAASSFLFDVDAGHPDNAYLDFTLRLDDGAGHLWALPLRLLMGEESSMIVSGQAGDAPLLLTAGHGPVALPNFQESTTSLLGADEWILPITEQAATLPPGPGPRRWFLRVTNPGTLPATIESWSFDVGGQELGLLDGLPATVGAGEEIVLRYPRPPLIVVDSLATTPDPAGPGGTVVIDSLVLRNDGASTVGGLNCVLDSAHPNASGFSASVLTFGGAAVPGGGTVAMDQTASFDIAAVHTEDEPIDLILLCSDGFDSLPVPFTIDVPYGRPQVDTVLIRDTASACAGCSGDNDGLADPSETVSVILSAINEGSLTLSGPLTATVTASPNSPVPFTLVSGNNITFGSGLLDPGASAVADVGFQLGVDPGALLGDRMVFDVAWSAGADSWTSELTIDVTGLPWFACNAPDDPMGDQVGGTGFDLRSCDYRSDGTMLQVRVNSWSEFGPTTQALWFLFYEAPSLYSVEFVPPAFPVLEDGCLTGNDISPTALPLTVDNQLTTSASVRLGLADLNELGSSLQVAFAAGFCLGFCDVYPNAASVWPSGGNPSCSQGQFIQINW